VNAEYGSCSDPGALGGEIVMEQVGGAPGDPQPGEGLSQGVTGRIQARRGGGAIALLQVGDDFGLVVPEAGDIAPFPPPLAQLPFQLIRVAVDPGAGLGVGEVHPLGVAGDEGLQPIGQPGLPEDEIGHEPQDRRAEGVALGLAVHRGQFGDAGAAHPGGPLDQGHRAAGTPQVVGGNQPVDAGAGHDHSR